MEGDPQREWAPDHVGITLLSSHTVEPVIVGSILFLSSLSSCKCGLGPDRLLVFACVCVCAWVHNRPFRDGLSMLVHAVVTLYAHFILLNLILILPLLARSRFFPLPPRPALLYKAVVHHRHSSAGSDSGVNIFLVSVRTLTLRYPVRISFLSSNKNTLHTPWTRKRRRL